LIQTITLLKNFSTLAAKELCKSINIDEAVAHGVAVHDTILSEEGNGKV